METSPVCDDPMGSLKVTSVSQKWPVFETKHLIYCYKMEVLLLVSFKSKLFLSYYCLSLRIISNNICLKRIGKKK